MQNKKTKVIICNTDNCENNLHGECKLGRIELRENKCENYKQIINVNSKQKVFVKIINECAECPSLWKRSESSRNVGECEYILYKNEDGNMSGKIVHALYIYRDENQPRPNFPSWCPLKDK